MKTLPRFIFFLAIASSFCHAEEKNAAYQEVFTKQSAEPGAVAFTPPPGWRFADSKELSPSVKVMVIGKAQNEFPPSMNLAVEPYDGSLKQYLKIVKSINNASRTEWKDLGMIRTQAGDGSLSQVDEKTEWGDVRIMHVILVKNGYAYILTAASLKKDFSLFYKDFFNAMRSLTINEDLFDMLTDPKRKADLEKAIADLKNEMLSLVQKQKEASPEASQSTQVQAVFNSEEFQNKYWNSFKSMLARDYGDMNTQWHDFLLKKLQKELTD